MSGVNPVVLLTFRTQGTAGAAKGAREVAKSLQDSGALSAKGATGLAKFSNGLVSMAKRGSSWLTTAKGVLGGFASFEAVQKATDFIKDSTGEAIKNQAAQRTLAIALKNSTGATKEQSDAVGEWLGKQAVQYGVAKDQLLPAFQRLVQSTGSITEAQNQLGLAMNVSTGMGKDLSTVSAALMKANNGNTASLARLGLKTKDANGKTLSLRGALDGLSKQFAGQASARASSFQGEMDRLNETVNETKIKIGDWLLPVIQKVMAWILTNAVPWLEQLVKAWQDNVGVIGDLHHNVTNVWNVLQAMFTWASKNMNVVWGLAMAITGVVIAFKLLQLGIAVTEGVMAAYGTIQAVVTALSYGAAGATYAQGAALVIFRIAMAAATAAQWLWNIAMGANPVGAVILGIVALIAVIVLLAANWKTVVRWGKRIWGGFLGWWSDTWNTAGAVFRNVWSGIGDFFRGAAHATLSGLEGFVNSAIDIINGITGNVSATWTWIPGTQGIPQIPHVKLPKLARGDDVKAGNSYIVGDAGRPELFVPGADGHVFPRVPALSGMSAQDIAATLPDATLSIGSSNGGPQIIQLVLPDGRVLFEWILDEAGNAEARL